MGQIKAIRRKYANMEKVEKDQPLSVSHPLFPFWARLKISKNRPTLVIDEEKKINRKTGKEEDGFVHREVTHTEKKDYMLVEPNPDKTDIEKMYIKRPSWLPKRLFRLETKFDMPKNLEEQYSKNNKK